MLIEHFETSGIHDCPFITDHYEQSLQPPTIVLHFTDFNLCRGTIRVQMIYLEYRLNIV